jgi:hypothetical protein
MLVQSGEWGNEVSKFVRTFPIGFFAFIDWY